MQARLISNSTQTLLTENSQFDEGELRFNHQALALWLRVFKEKNIKDQVFIAAGAEDLRALLPRLQLDEEGDETFILVRPYIHSMVLYIRRESIGLCCFLLDSQTWGLRYYPTRLIIQTLQQYDTSVRIFLSGTTLQSQKVQRGCTEFSLKCMEYLSSYGRRFFNHILNTEMTAVTQPKHSVDCYENTFQLSADALPLELMHALQQPSHYLQQLDKLITTHYQNENELDQIKINKTVKEMQGCFLTLSSYLRQRPLYDVDINLQACRVTIQFPNKDYFYSNFLIYSPELSPSDVTMENVSFLFGNELSVTYDQEKHCLIYQADDISQLQQAIENLAHQSADLFHLSMRQQLALQVFAEDLQEKLRDEFELEKICKNKTGGLDTQQVQLALAHVFAEHKKEIYVPNFKELSGKLFLDQLKKDGLNFAAFSLPVDDEHQVAVWIKLGYETHEVVVIDSLPCRKNTKHAKEKLNNLLVTDIPCEIQFKKSPYQLQKDAWSCGVFTLAHLQYLYALSKTPEQKSEQRSILDVHTLVRYYYYAYKSQQKIEMAAEEAAVKNDAVKRILLPSLQLRYPDARIFYKLKSLVDYLLEILSKNKSLQQMCEEYATKQDDIGQAILKIACLYLGEADLLESVLPKLIPAIVCEPEQEQFLAMDLLVGPHLRLTLSERGKARLQRKLIKELLDEFVNLKDENSESILIAILRKKLEFFDDQNKNSFYKCLNRIGGDSYIHLTFLVKIIVNQLRDLSDILESEEARCNNKQQESERQVLQAELAAKTKTVKEILSSAGATNIDESLSRELANNLFAYYFLKRYVYNSNFFQGCEQEKVIVTLKSLSGLKSSPDICNAIRLFPGKDTVTYLRFLKPFVEDKKQLYSFLNIFHPNARCNIAILYKEKISKLSILSGVLLLLDPKNRLKLAIQCKNKITNFTDLHTILKLLPLDNDDRLLLAIACCDLLLKKQLRGVGSDRFFAYSISDDIRILLMHLPEKDRFPFVKQCKDKIVVEDLTSIIDVLPSDDRFEFAKEFQDLITNIHNLVNLVLGLPKDHLCLEFAIDNFNRILPKLTSVEAWEWKETDNLLSHLSNMREQFINSLAIKTIDELIIVLKTTQLEKNRAAILHAHAHVLQNQLELDQGSVLSLEELKQRLIIAEKNHTEKKNYAEQKNIKFSYHG